MIDYISLPKILYLKASEAADLWEEYHAGADRLVIARYKVRDTHRRSRYSLFLFREDAEFPVRCFNYEPDDIEGKAIAFWGEHEESSHINHGIAPNEMTVDNFRSRAFMWFLRNARTGDVPIERSKTEKRYVPGQTQSLQRK